jgi:hypothetical protein
MQQQNEGFLEAATLRLQRNEDGEPVAVIGEKRVTLGHILSIYPISNREHFVSLRDTEGNEIGIVEEAHTIEGGSRRVLQEELERSYFLPQITDIVSITDKLGVLTWRVETNRGPRTFEVRRPRQNVRSVGGGRYIVKDVDGNRYDIRRLRNLGPKSQFFMREFV